MRSRFLLVVVAVLLLGGGVGAYYLLKDKNKENAPATSNNSSTKTPPPAVPAPSPATGSTSPKKACDILTSEIATTVLGDPVQPGSSNAETPQEADHVIVSQCIYTAANGSKTTSLLMRLAADAEGSAHDKEQFSANKPTNAETVNGYGDSAYWNTDFRELHILKGSTWYVITAGPSETPSRTLDQAKKLADQLATKL